jgi:hypothetical protein
MAKFIVGIPVVTKVSSVVVDTQLPVGRHRFQLEVLNDTDQKSTPDIVVVQVSELNGSVEPVSAVLPPRGSFSPAVSTRATISPTATTSAVSVASTRDKTE